MNNKYTNSSLIENYYKTLFFFGILFLIACIFFFKSESSVEIPKFGNLFITEGTLKIPSVRGKFPSLFIQSTSNRMLRLSTYSGYEIHQLRKFKDRKIKVWWFSNNLKQIYNPNHVSSLYQAEIDGQIIISYAQQKELHENRPKYQDTIFLAAISFIFLLLALMGYINMLDSKKAPKLK